MPRAFSYTQMGSRASDYKATCIWRSPGNGGPSFKPCCPTGCRYRALGIATESAVPEAEKRAERSRRRMERLHLSTAMRGNVNRNLPRNVPY